MDFKEFTKSLYRNYRVGKYRNFAKWEQDSRLHIGIEFNRYFTKKKWLQNFRSLFPTVDKYCQIKFYSNKYEKYALLPTLDIICTTWTKPSFVTSTEKLKWIHIMQSGSEFLQDIQSFNGVQITTTSGITSEAVAEHVLCVSLALLKQLYYSFEYQRKQRWAQENFLEGDFRLLKNRKIGILGLGYNGQSIARLFKSLGCEVMAYDKEDIKSEYVDCLYRSNQLDMIIDKSEILVICLPLTSETKNLITLYELKLLGNKGILINVARGEILNEADLIYALRHRIISGAALDVFHKEPLPRSSLLWTCPNTILTTHIAGNINNHVDKIQASFIERLKKYSVK